MIGRLLIASFIVITSAQALSNESFDQGIKQFQDKNYQAAIQSFEAAVASEPKNASAYFNLGLSYNGDKQYGEAIWAFEKVLKLKPNDTEAIENIESNYQELEGNVKWWPELNRFERSLFSFSSNTWAILAILFSICSGLCIFLFRKVTVLSKKRLFLLLSICSVGMMGFSIYIAAGAAGYSMNNSAYAVITSGKIETYSDGSNDDKEPTGIQLLEGEKVRIVESFEGTKRKVKTANDATYFVKVEDISPL